MVAKSTGVVIGLWKPQLGEFDNFASALLFPMPASIL